MKTGLLQTLCSGLGSPASQFNSSQFQSLRQNRKTTSKLELPRQQHLNNSADVPSRRKSGEIQSSVVSGQQSQRREANFAVHLNWPTALTLLRLLLLPLFLWILLANAVGAAQSSGEIRHLHWLALAVFGVMVLTDKLDGFLARRWHQETWLGAVLDALADKLLIFCSLIALSFPWIAPAGYAVPFLVVLGVYGKDLGVGLGTLVLMAAIGKVDTSPRLCGKVSTVLQLTLVAATLLAADIERLSARLAELLVRGLWWAVILAAAVAALDYILEGSRQYAAYRHRGVAGGTGRLAESMV